MPSLFRLNSLDDPRIAAYRNLRDRELAREGGRFIAEGEMVVRRLLESSHEVESLLVADERLERIATTVGDHPVYLAPHELVNRIVGYKFHSGVMAVGRRPAPMSLETLAAGWSDRVTLVICDEIANTENLGALIRIAAGLGASGMVLGPTCCDAYYRQSIRVSMGAVFSLPMIRSECLLRDARRLREQWGFELAATVLADDAEQLATAGRGARLAVLFGNEARGLDGKLVSACDRRITIPMRLGTDSLNVAICAGIVLHHFTHGDRGDWNTVPPNTSRLGA